MIFNILGILFQILKRKWKSLLHHVTDTHEWTVDAETYSCDHATLPDEEPVWLKWLERGSPSFEALQAIVENKKLLHDLEKMTLFKHTGNFLSTYVPDQEMSRRNRVAIEFILYAFQDHQKYITM